MPRRTKRCPACRERLNPNAFPRGSGVCYPCRDKRKAEQAERLKLRDLGRQY